MSINAERIHQTIIQNEQYLQEINKLVLQGSHFFIFPFEVDVCNLELPFKASPGPYGNRPILLLKVREP